MISVRYLNGIDWVVAGLMHELEHCAGIGNWSQVVVQLEGELDDDTFCAAVQRFHAAHPILQGKTVRGWQLAPCWKIPRLRHGHPPLIPYWRRSMPQDTPVDDVLRELQQSLILPPGKPGAYTGFTSLRRGAETFLAFRFDHRLFDARGAELFLRALVEYAQSGTSAAPPPQVCVAEPAHLRPWKTKFESGKQVLRMLRRQRAHAPFRLPQRSSCAGAHRFSLLALDDDQTARFIDQAYEQAGYLMLTAYVAAKALEAVDAFLRAHREPLAGYMIPCSTDLGRQMPSEPYFNHVALTCFSTAAGGDPPTWPRLFARQFFEQTRDNMPGHFENAWKLARILPAPLFGKLLLGPFRDFAGTFSLANVGGGLSDLTAMGGCRVHNVFHMPLVPPVPGLGFFLNSWQGRINLSLVSFDTVLSAAEHEQLFQQAVARFQGS